MANLLREMIGGLGIGLVALTGIVSQTGEFAKTTGEAAVKVREACEAISPCKAIVKGPVIEHPVAVVRTVRYALPNGHLIREDDPLLTKGWSSSSWVGADRGHDLERFDNEANAALGFSLGFYHNNSCSPDHRCTISPDVIRSRVQRIEL